MALYIFDQTFLYLAEFTDLEYYDLRMILKAKKCELQQKMTIRING